MKEKQIEEMASVICWNCPLHNDHCGFQNDSKLCPSVLSDAKQLYNAGYRKQSEWISVHDRLPEKEGETVLYYDGKVVDACLFYSERFYTIDLYESDRIDGVTHWMPLPKPPKGE